MGSVAITFSKELDCTDCCMRVSERLDFKVTGCNQLKFLIFGNIKQVFRRLAFSQANIFFLKLKRVLTKIDVSCAKSERRVLDPPTHLHQFYANCQDIRYVSDH